MPTTPASTAGCRIASTTLGSSEPHADYQFERLGRPLLYFGPAYGRVRIAHAGGDGRFGGLNAATPCEPNPSDPDGYGARRPRALPRLTPRT